MGLYSPIITNTIIGHKATNSSITIDCYMNNSAGSYILFLKVINPITGESYLKTGIKPDDSGIEIDGEGTKSSMVLQKTDCVEGIWAPGAALQCSIALMTTDEYDRITQDVVDGTNINNYEYIFNIADKQSVSAWSKAVIFTLVDNYEVYPQATNIQVFQNEDYLFEAFIDFGQSEDFLSWYSVAYSGVNTGRLIAPKKNGFSYLFKNVAADLAFTIIYQTDSGYQETKTYKLVTEAPYIEMDDTITVELSATSNHAFGFINTQITLKSASTEDVTGTLFVERQDCLNGAGRWEVLKAIPELDLESNSSIQINIKDVCANPTVPYKYRAYFRIEGTSFTYSKYSQEMAAAAILVPDDMYLASKNRQLRIRFNPALTNLKKNLATSVTPTLGAQFPIVQKNGKIHYQTFSIGGLISYHGEENGDSFDDSLFFSFNDAEYQGLALEEREIVLERHFREAVVDFLSDNTIKLFKSTPEGAMLVRLTDLSLSSEKALGRNIYSFTASATEVAEFNLENCQKYISDKTNDLVYVSIKQ